MKIKAKFDKDTKRMHRFNIESKDGVAGSIYVSKDLNPLPEEITVELKAKSDE